jgi:ribose 5-phosphate isomerase A
LNPKQDNIEKEKKNAATEAVKQVKDGFVLGLGSGSTAAYVIEEIGRRIQREKIRVLGVPTSHQAFILAARNRIPITTLEEHLSLDLTIDGADQVDTHLNLIKGMGGALTREKIVAEASKYYLIVADENKRAKTLGEQNHPVPIEVLPFAVPLVVQNIKKLKGKPVLREGKGKVGPVVTDNGNVLVDAYFGPIHEPVDLASRLKALSGVVETGLFIGMADAVYFGKPSGIE